MASPRQFDIDLVDDGVGEGLKVRFHNGRIQRAVGLTKFSVQRSIGTKDAAIRVYLWVVPDLPEGIILGRPFLEKCACYWSKKPEH
jgi:hypothetical protein